MNSRSGIIQRSRSALKNCNKIPTASNGGLARKSSMVTLCQARKFPNVYSHIFSKGLYLLFDLQGPAPDTPSCLTTARPGQLCHVLLPLPSADPAFGSRLLALLSVYTFPNSRRKSEYQTDLRSFEVAKGCYQVWRGVLCL